MASQSWAEEFNGAITVCDSEGIILDMNRKATETFKGWGGKKLIGTNLLDCHPESARSKLKELLETQQTNVYTIEKNDVIKLIYQAPWYVSGQFSGFVELSLVIPAQMAHFVRDE